MRFGDYDILLKHNETHGLPISDSASLKPIILLIYPSKVCQRVQINISTVHRSNSNSKPLKTGTFAYDVTDTSNFNPSSGHTHRGNFDVDVKNHTTIHTSCLFTLFTGRGLDTNWEAQRSFRVIELELMYPTGRGWWGRARASSISPTRDMIS